VDGETRTSRGLTISISAISAGLFRVSLCVLEQTNEVFPICNVGGDYRRSSRGDVCSNRTAISLGFRRPSADDNFALKPVCRFISRLMLGHRFGAFRRPAALGLLLRIARPLLGSWFLPKQLCKVQQRTLCKLFLGPSQKADLRHLGAGPTRQLRST
jgi:hypothetical protein